MITSNSFGAMLHEHPCCPDHVGGSPLGATNVTQTQAIEPRPRPRAPVFVRTWAPLRPIAICAYVIVVAASLAWATPSRSQDALGSTLHSLLEHARAQSPELAAMRQEADAARERIQPAGALADPMFRMELENVNNYGNGNQLSVLPWRVGETKYTFVQPLPAWGKRGLRREVAEADAQRAEASASATWSELAARIKAAYAQYYLAARNERLVREIVELIAGLEKIAQARYAGGLVAQQDAIRAQVEQTAMRSELIALDSEKRQMRARINALLGREADAALADPASLRALPTNALAAEELVRRALANNPALAAEEARIRGAEKSRELTLRNRYPDFQVGISPTQMRSRITSWGVMVEMNIPLQQESRRSQEREAAAMASAARSRSQALAKQLLGEMGMNLAAIEAAQRSEALVTTQLLPQSELSLRSALAAYETGKVDFATLLDAQRQIRKAQQDRLKAQVEARLRLAEIERILGEDL